MKLNEIITKSIFVDNSLRLSLRLNKDDLNTFKKVIENCTIKNFFENCIKNFYNIDEFKDIKDFYYIYTKDKSFTFSIDINYKTKLEILSKNLNLDISDIIRFIILKTISKI